MKLLTIPLPPKVKLSALKGKTRPCQLTGHTCICRPLKMSNPFSITFLILIHGVNRLIF